MKGLFHRLLDSPAAYRWLRHGLLGGLPFDRWVKLYGLDDPSQRISDFGCGPADILRYIHHGSGPGFYLGLDMDQVYLDQAAETARRIGINAQFETCDLSTLSEQSVRDEVLELLNRHQITRILLLGVIHHIDDFSVRTTLDLLAAAPSVRQIITQDVVTIPKCRFNNLLASLDRGKHVRTEEEYRSVLIHKDWTDARVDWTSPGVSAVRYIHFTLTRR